MTDAVASRAEVLKGAFFPTEKKKAQAQTLHLVPRGKPCLSQSEAVGGSDYCTSVCHWHPTAASASSVRFEGARVLGAATGAVLYDVCYCAGPCATEADYFRPTTLTVLPPPIEVPADRGPRLLLRAPRARYSSAEPG